MNAECSNCRFFNCIADGKGVCRRFPPTIPQGDDHNRFPTLYSEGWCGEHDFTQDVKAKIMTSILTED